MKQTVGFAFPKVNFHFHKSLDILNLHWHDQILNSISNQYNNLEYLCSSTHRYCTNSIICRDIINNYIIDSPNYTFING